MFMQLLNSAIPLKKVLIGLPRNPLNQIFKYPISAGTEPSMKRGKVSKASGSRNQVSLNLVSISFLNLLAPTMTGWRKNTLRFHIQVQGETIMVPPNTAFAVITLPPSFAHDSICFSASNIISFP